MKTPRYAVLLIASSISLVPATGFATKGGLPACESAVETCQGNLGACDSDLGNCESDLGSCDSDLTSCESDLADCRASLAACGDGAARDGGDIPCHCGDTVLTNTTLDLSFDPVTTETCTGRGLVLAAGVQLDLNGLVVSGSNAEDGLSVPNGGAVTGGTVRGFGVGIRIATTAIGSHVTVAGMMIENNATDGAVIQVSHSDSRVVFEGVTVQGNGGRGIHVLTAPGASNLDADEALPSSSFGFVLRSFSIVRDNAAHGIQLGDGAQTADVAASIEGVTIHANHGAGIVMEQKVGLLPGADCGESAGQPGCTGAWIANNAIHDNGGPGVELRSGFVVPVDSSLLGFRANRVFHNAMAGEGCSVEQSAPQILVAGPVGLGDGGCADAADVAACAERNRAGNNRHCIWDQAGSCRAAWDLRGSFTSDGCGHANGIFGYEVAGGSVNSVGMRAMDGAKVLATNNSWHGNPKVSFGGDSTIVTDPSCSGLGCGLP